MIIQYLKNVRLNFYRFGANVGEELLKEFGKKIFRPEHFPPEEIERQRKKMEKIVNYARRRVEELERPPVPFKEKLRRWLG